MVNAVGDFLLTLDELREVVRYSAESARGVLPEFERAAPVDRRPRAAIDAAWVFVDGGRRTKLQRVASVEAHRAAKAASTEVARLAARSAGDAASAAYLHPIARGSQVGHILRAAAIAVHIAELNAGGDPAVTDLAIHDALRRATPVMIDVLGRYPSPAPGGGRVTQLMIILDAALRSSR